MSNPSSSRNTAWPAEPQTSDPQAESKSTVHEAKKVVQELRDEAVHEAENAKNRAIERGQEFAQQQKERAADEVHVFGSAFHSAAETLENEGQHMAAQCVEACAKSLDDTANYLRQRRFGELIQDANQFARRHPEVFLGGMLLAGLAAARFLKAHEPKDHLDEQHLLDDMDLVNETEDVDYVGGVPAFGQAPLSTEPTSPSVDEIPNPIDPLRDPNL